MKAGEKDKPVSDQWLDPFVIVDENDKPVGPVEVRLQPFLRYVHRHSIWMT